MPKEHPLFARIPNKVHICLFFSQTQIQLSKSVYLHVQVPVSSRLAHMLLRYTNVRKSVSTIKIWLKSRFVRQAEYSTTHTGCGGVGERAERKLREEVLFVQTRWVILCCRDIWGYMLKTSKETRTENKKLLSRLLLTLLKAISFEVDSMSCSYMREVEVWGELLLNSSSLEAQTLTAAQSCIPTAQPRPCVSVNFKKQWWYKLLQDKA